MDAVIIAGGLGTRLFPLTLSIPKSLIPFLDLPLIVYPMAVAREMDCKSIAIAGGHLSEMLKSRLSSFVGLSPDDSLASEGNLTLKFVEEKEPLGTGGALANAIQSLCLVPPILVMNGDVITDVSAREFLSFHKKRGTSATLLCSQVSVPERYGAIEVSGGSVTSFREKGERIGEPPYFVNAGIYIFEEDAVRRTTSISGAFSLEEVIFPALAKEGKLSAFSHQGLWQDVGTLASYFRTQFDVLGYWLTRGREKFLGDREDFSLFRDFVYIHKEAKIGRGTDLFHRVIVMKGAEIGSGCRLQNVIALPYSRVGNGCNLTSVTVDSETVVPNDTVASDRIFSKDRAELLTL